MKTLLISFLALVASTAAEEVKTGTKKRGIDQIGYDGLQLPLGGYANLAQGGHGAFLGGISSPGIAIGAGYGHSQTAQISGLSGGYQDILLTGLGLGSIGTQLPLIGYGQGGGLFGGGHIGALGNSYELPTIGLASPPKLNGYDTGYGLGAYAGSSFIEKQIAGGGITSKFPQSFPLENTIPQPPPVAYNPRTSYGLKYTQAVTSPSLPVENPVPSQYFAPATPHFSQPQQPSFSISTPVSYAAPYSAQLQHVSYAAPQSQPGIAFGSGSLGISQLKNGNYALGSGSIGYSASLNAAAATPSSQSVAPINLQGISGAYAGPQGVKGY